MHLAWRMKGGTAPFFYGWIIVAASFIITSAWGYFFIYGVFFKPLINEFGWSSTATSLAFSIQTSVYSLCVIPMGRFYDRHGPRLAVGIGAILVGVGSTLCSLVTSLWQLYLFWGVMIGVGSSAFWVPVVSTLNKWFLKKRGLVMGVISTGVGVGTFIAAPATDYLITTIGWRMAFLVEGVFLLILFMASALALRSSPQEMGLSPYGQEEVVEAKIKPVALHEVVGAVGGLNEPDELRFETRHALKSKSLWMIYTTFVFGCLCESMVLVHMVPFAINIDISGALAAVALGAVGFSSIFGKVVMGALSDRIGRIRILSITYAVQASSMFLIIFTGNLWMLYVFAIIFGFSYGGWVPQYPNMMRDFFGLRHAGILMGILSTGWGLGGLLGPTLGGLIFDLSGNYQSAFLLGEIVSILAFLISIFLKPPRTANN
ncbi:MAG: MFS transporter [Nitrososphaeria archaeon]|nr:MFS transporter [Nitrososphaeria archaeon]NIN52284.1 MFS transporter [Nitrososphaeria archaeon]NIQ32762.1 MFS transporter [Nitrososphaeria archaeon]